MVSNNCIKRGWIPTFRLQERLPVQGKKHWSTVPLKFKMQDGRNYLALLLFCVREFLSRTPNCTETTRAEETERPRSEGGNGRIPAGSEERRPGEQTKGEVVKRR